MLSEQAALTWRQVDGSYISCSEASPENDRLTFNHQMYYYVYLITSKSFMNGLVAALRLPACVLVPFSTLFGLEHYLSILRMSTSFFFFSLAWIDRICTRSFVLKRKFPPYHLSGEKAHATLGDCKLSKLLIADRSIQMT